MKISVMKNYQIMVYTSQYMPDSDNPIDLIYMYFFKLRAQVHQNDLEVYNGIVCARARTHTLTHTFANGKFSDLQAKGSPHLHPHQSRHLLHLQLLLECTYLQSSPSTLLTS